MKTQNVPVVAAVPEARVAMLILTWLTIEQVATRYEEAAQTRLHQLIAHAVSTIFVERPAPNARTPTRLSR
jgi:hypothetical protein